MATFHCFWSGPVTNHHILSISSLNNTQTNVDGSRVNIKFWTLPDQVSDAQVEFSKYDLGNLSIHAYNPDEEAKGTILEGHSSLLRPVNNLPHFADVFRLLILHKYGGHYFDLDVLFLKNMIQTRFVPDNYCYKWEVQPYCNTALMGLARNSFISNMYLEKAISEQSFLPWKLYTLPETYSVLKIFETSVFDPLWLKVTGNAIYNTPIDTFEEFFTKPMPSDFQIQRDFFPEAYAFHWHNNWSLSVNSVYDSCIAQFYRLHVRPRLSEAHQQKIDIKLESQITDDMTNERWWVAGSFLVVLVLIILFSIFLYIRKLR